MRLKFVVAVITPSVPEVSGPSSDTLNLWWRQNLQRICLNIFSLLGFGSFICVFPQKAALQLYPTMSFYLMPISMAVGSGLGTILWFSVWFSFLNRYGESGSGDCGLHKSFSPSSRYNTGPSTFSCLSPKPFSLFSFFNSSGLLPIPLGE